MDRLAFLEILDTRFRVRERVRLGSLPATIGRSYDNAVILDDRYVCPRHARIVLLEEGGYAVEDLGSVNGLFRLKERKRATRLALRPGDTFRVGRTLLRFCTEDQAVPLAEVDGGRGAVGVVQEPRKAALAAAIASSVLAIGFYLDSFERVRVADVIGMLLMILLGLAVWAGLWSFGTRLVSSRFRFVQHWVWACALTALLFVSVTVLDYLQFAVAATGVGWPLGLPLLCGIGWLLLYGHLTLASGLQRSTRVVATGLITLSVVGIGGLIGYAETETFSTRPRYDGTLKPVSVALLRTESIDRFFADLVRLQDELDQEGR